MNNEAFDRAVKALGNKDRDGRRFSKNETPETWERYSALVRTVLKAVREPSNEVCSAVNEDENISIEGCSVDHFNEMEGGKEFELHKLIFNGIIDELLKP